MDWSLYRCGRTGHITYAPDEAHLRGQMRAATAAGDLWQCLRCGAFVPGRPHGTGPAAQAPIVRRGKEIRGDLILKLFAVERGFRVLLFAAVAFGIWKFANSRLSISAAIKKELPIVQSLFNQLGFTLSHSLLDRLHALLHISTGNLHLIALGIAGLAVVSGIEAFALWQAHRWGEYFAMIVTSLGLPLEVYELSKAITATKATLFVLNVGLVVYLVYSRRLFGVRGGKEAYEMRLRAESVVEAAAKAAAGIGSATPGSAAAAEGQAPAYAGTQAAPSAAWLASERPSQVSPWPAAAPPAHASPWHMSGQPADATPWPAADQPAPAPRATSESPWAPAGRPAPANTWPAAGRPAPASPPAGAAPWPAAEPFAGSPEVPPVTPPVRPAGPPPAASTIRHARPGAAGTEPHPPPGTDAPGNG